MAMYSLGAAGKILYQADDVSKIKSYLYRQNELLKYMFSNLTPEDNYSSDAYEKFLEDGDQQTRLSVSLDQISAEMITSGNIVSAINLSREGVKIKGDRISLEGLVTVNSYFRVGLDGSIEARNGMFSGHLSSSTMDSSEITLGGNGMDGKIIVQNSSGTEIGRWDKNGINVKQGSISGTGITLGGSGNTGKISLLNGSNVEIGKWDKNGQVMMDANGTVIGTWNAAGIDVKKGDISGTTITVGGSGMTGGITVKDAGNTTIGTWNAAGIDVKRGTVSGTTINVGGNGSLGKIAVFNTSNKEIGTWDSTGLTMRAADGQTVIGSWTASGIDAKKGSISGTGITVGGNGNTGFLKIENASGVEIGKWDSGGLVMKDTTGTTIGTWNPLGIDIKKGSVRGTAIYLGGTGTAGSLTIYDTTGTNVIGSWGASGITVSKGTLDIRTNRDFIFHAGSDYIRIGDFEVSEGYNRQILESYDEVTGMSAEPGGTGRMYLWAGYNGSASTTAFYVDNTDDIGYGNTVVNGGLFVNGALLLNGTNLSSEIARIWDAIRDLEPSE